MQLMALRHMDAVLAVSRPLADRLAKPECPRKRFTWFRRVRTPCTKLDARRRAKQLGLNASARVIGLGGSPLP